MNTFKSQQIKGFTIVELIVVIAVIGILAGISIVGFSRYQADTRDAQRSARIKIISEALEKYYDNNGEYPSCQVMQGSVLTLTKTVFPNLSPSVFLTPKSAVNVTNSVSCTDLTGTSGGPDSFAYVGDTSPDCISGAACLQWTLKYREEGTGNIISTSSRRQFYFSSSEVPVLSATPGGFSQVNLTWSVVAKAGSYSVQYATDNSFTNNLITQSVSGTSLTIPGLTTGVTYYFRVRAVNGVVFSNWSNVRSIVINFTSTAWTEHAPSPTGYWTSAASSADGNKLIAGITFNGGYLYTSTDGGVTWIMRSSAGNLGWGSATSSADGTKLAAAPSGNGYIYTSTDSGATWSEHISVGARDWRSVSSSVDGTKLAAVSIDGYIYTSVDSGTTWVSRTIPGSLPWWFVASSADGTKLIASATLNNYVYTSTDSGVTWSASTGAGSRDWRQVTMSADGTKLAAEAVNNYIYTSLDGGTTWAAQASAGSRFWMLLAASADGSKLFSGAGAGGYLYNGIYGP